MQRRKKVNGNLNFDYYISENLKVIKILWWSSSSCSCKYNFCFYRKDEKIMQYVIDNFYNIVTGIASAVTILDYSIKMINYFTNKKQN